MAGVCLAAAGQNALSKASEDLTAGRFAEAAAGFRSVLAGNPNMPDALFGLGVACGQLGRTVEAQRALERYVRVRPSSSDGHAALGAVLLSAGERKRARSEFERARALEPGNLECIKGLARLELGDFNAQRTVELLRPFSAAPDFDDDAQFLLGAAYASSSEPRLAISILRPLLDRRPPLPEVFITAAIAGARAGDTGFAERACAIGLRAYLNSDEIEQRCLRIVSAGFVKELEASRRGAPEDFPTLIVLGRLLTDVVESADSPIRERGLEFLKQAVALRPADATALYNLGRCLRVLARPDAALAALRNALAAAPPDELRMLILTQTALAEQQLAHDAAAEDLFRQAMERNRALPRRLPSAALAYYQFLEQASRAREAAAVRDEILRWDAGFLPARMALARALADAGRPADAVAEAEAVARNADPANAQLLRQAHLLLLQTYSRLGRREEAARHQAWLNAARAADRP